MMSCRTSGSPPVRRSLRTPRRRRREHSRSSSSRRQQLGLGQEGHVLRHAVDAAEVAAVGHRDAQIGDGAPKRIDQRARRRAGAVELTCRCCGAGSHYPSLRGGFCRRSRSHIGSVADNGEGSSAAVRACGGSAAARANACGFASTRRLRLRRRPGRGRLLRLRLAAARRSGGRLGTRRRFGLGLLPPASAGLAAVFLRTVFFLAFGGGGVGVNCATTGLGRSCWELSPIEVSCTCSVSGW